ncbi:MAG: hypothetical protein ACO1SV_21165 [Fimbriimonas sp.]
MRIFTATAVIAALGIAGAASAQTSTIDLTPVGISVRGGVVLPLDSTLENLGTSLLGLGIEYTLPTSYLRTGETFLALDYFAPRFAGDKGSVFPLTINQRWYNDVDAARRTYYFLGLGATFIDIVNSDVAIGVRGGFGTELGDRIFAEVAGYLSDKKGGARANAVGLYLGYRF